MKRSSFSLIVGLVVSSLSFGSVVEFKGQAIDVAGTTVKVSPTATLTTAGGPTELKMTGYGIRKKSVAFISVNVYVATSYVDLGTTLNAKDPIQDLKSAKGRVIVLDMLRTMTAADIRTAFEEALDVNAVDLNSKSIQNVFSQFKGDLKTGQRIILASYPSEKSQETLVIELPQSNIQESGSFLGLDFWKIWFGEPVDSYMGELKAKLVGTK